MIEPRTTRALRFDFAIQIFIACQPLLRPSFSLSLDNQRYDIGQADEPNDRTTVETIVVIAGRRRCSRYRVADAAARKMRDESCVEPRSSDDVKSSQDCEGILPPQEVHKLPLGKMIMVHSTNRRMFSLATAVLALLAMTAGSLAVTAAADSPHASHMLKCASVCADCQVQCDSCSAYCAKLVAEGKKEHAKCMSLCVDCADCCKMCASLCARQSDLCAHACECCTKCCEVCAAACEKFPDDKQMAACAKACRNCAKECTAMAKMTK